MQHALASHAATTRYASPAFLALDLASPSRYDGGSRTQETDRAPPDDPALKVGRQAGPTRQRGKRDVITHGLPEPSEVGR